MKELFFTNADEELLTVLARIAVVVTILHCAPGFVICSIACCLVSGRAMGIAIRDAITILAIGPLDCGIWIALISRGIGIAIRDRTAGFVIRALASGGIA